MPKDHPFGHVVRTRQPHGPTTGRSNTCVRPPPADRQPGQPGYKCGNRPIWNNNDEIIYLHLPDGTGMQIETGN